MKQERINYLLLDNQKVQCRKNQRIKEGSNEGSNEGSIDVKIKEIERKWDLMFRNGARETELTVAPCYFIFVEVAVSR